MEILTSIPEDSVTTFPPVTPRAMEGFDYREQSRTVAQASTIQEQLRRVQELAKDRHAKHKEEEFERERARLFAQGAATQEQLRRIQEDADQKHMARNETEMERERRIEIAVSLAEEERQRRIREDKQRLGKRISQPEQMPISEESSSLDIPMSSPNFGSFPSPSAGSLSSPTATTVVPSSNSSPPFSSRSSTSSSPEPPRRKVRKTRGRARSGPVPRPDSPKMRRRARKNSRERQRRVELNEQFERLSCLLNVDRKGKMRKTSILLEAINVIGTLRTENSRLRAQNPSGTPTHEVPARRKNLARPRSTSNQYPMRSASSIPMGSTSSSLHTGSPLTSGDVMLQEDTSLRGLDEIPLRRSRSSDMPSLSPPTVLTRSASASPSHATSRPGPFSLSIPEAPPQPSTDMFLYSPFPYDDTSLSSMPPPLLAGETASLLQIDEAATVTDPFLTAPPFPSFSALGLSSDGSAPTVGKIASPLQGGSQGRNVFNEFTKSSMEYGDDSQIKLDFSTGFHNPLHGGSEMQLSIPDPIPDSIPDSPRTIKTEGSISPRSILGTPLLDSHTKMKNEMDDMSSWDDLAILDHRATSTTPTLLSSDSFDWSFDATFSTGTRKKTI